MLAGGAEPQMSLVKEEPDTVLFGADGEALYPLAHGDTVRRDFVTDRGTRVGSYRASDTERGFLANMCCLGENLGGHVGARHNALNRPRTVTYLKKTELPAGPAGCEPAAYGDPLSIVGGEVLDVYPRWRVGHGIVVQF